MKLLSLNRIVNDFIDQTSDVYENMRPTLIEWAKQTDLKIDTEYQFGRKYAVMNPTNCCMDIPCDGVHVLGIILGDYGADCGLYFDDVYNGSYNYEELTFTDSLGLPVTWAFTWYDDTIHSVETRWHIEGNQVVFEDCLDGYTVTMCYLGYKNTDPQGYPMVNESHRDALTKKLEILTLGKEKHRKLISGEYINQISAEIDKLSKEYSKAVRRARGADMEPSNSAMNDIAAMLNNPLTGHGNYLLQALF
jgi:hypothetical protein